MNADQENRGEWAAAATISWAQKNLIEDGNMPVLIRRKALNPPVTEADNERLIGVLAGIEEREDGDYCGEAKDVEGGS